MGVHGQDPFTALVARARAGDAGAWSELYHDVAPLVIGYLRAQRLPDPEDVAGEVLLEIVRGIERFSGDRSGFRSWALAIAHHRLLDARRRAERRPSTPTPTEALDTACAPDDPEAETIAADGFGRLEPALRELTEDQRTVLLLRVIGDLPIAEVARITGKRQGAVKQLQQRAADAMRRTLDRDAAAQDATGGRAIATGRPPLDAERTLARYYRATRDVDGPENASRTRWTT